MEPRILNALRHFLYKTTGGGCIKRGVAYPSVSLENENHFKVSAAVIKVIIGPLLFSDLTICTIALYTVLFRPTIKFKYSSEPQKIFC